MSLGTAGERYRSDEGVHLNFHLHGSREEQKTKGNMEYLRQLYK
jgi:hypothetical protein